MRNAPPSLTRLSPSCLGRLVVFVTFAIFSFPAVSQEEDLTDPVVAYNKTVSAIQLQKWEEALQITNGVIREHSEDAFARYGPVFGHFHFLTGLALLGNDQAKEAIVEFNSCY